MAWTIDDVLADKRVEVISKRVISEYKFRVGTLKTVITIRTYQEKAQTGYIFEQSHNIKTPKQVGPYRPSRPWADYEAYAVHLAIDSIAQYYEEAVNAGYKPEESWLVSNKNFVG